MHVDLGDGGESAVSPMGEIEPEMIGVFLRATVAHLAVAVHIKGVEFAQGEFGTSGPFLLIGMWMHH